MSEWNLIHKFDTWEFPHKTERVHSARCIHAYITQLYIMSIQPVKRETETEGNRQTDRQRQRQTETLTLIHGLLWRPLTHTQGVNWWVGGVERVLHFSTIFDDLLDEVHCSAYSYRFTLYSHKHKRHPIRTNWCITSIVPIYISHCLTVAPK